MATAGRVLILPRGNYDENTVYEMLDVVSYNGSSWLAKKTSQGMIPCEENNEYWQNMVDIKVADNLTTKEKGMLLDASQGNVLNERISTEVTALLGKINTNKEAADAELKELDKRLDEAESISKGRNPGVTFETYEEMVYAIDEMDANELKVGQNIYIADVGIPDLWIYSVEESKADFIYVSDEDIVSELELNTTFQVGYYKIAQLETQKVNLSEYAKQEDVEEIENQINEQNKNLTASDDTKFRFATDGEGNYGYLKADDSFVPFSSGLKDFQFGYFLNEITGYGRWHTFASKSDEFYYCTDNNNTSNAFPNHEFKKVLRKDIAISPSYTTIGRTPENKQINLRVVDTNTMQISIDSAPSGTYPYVVILQKRVD